ncbi:M50 family peptidase [Leucothrix sargassi]|nr:M50 family peptidase [Leucothrix sargassi]
MYIDNQDKGASTRGEKIFILILMGLFFFMMTMELISNYEPRKLSIVFFLVFWIPLLFLHEFGHAVMAKLCGWEVKRTVIGIGSVFHRTKLFGAPMEIRMIPLEGFVSIAPLNMSAVRLKHALIYFAGPGIELLVFFAIMLFLGTDQMFSQNDNYMQIALQSLGFAALVGAVINLIPLGIRTDNGTSPNDGLGIILSLFRSKEDYEQWIRENK